ncbi:putative membrane protein [Bacillus phage vB_BanH_McCartney]|nr:putative membrane protein [Bacillus phage vB_BanH_McCartney]
MIGMQVREFYKRRNYETFWRYLLGMFICTFIFIPLGLFLKLIDKIFG